VLVNGLRICVSAIVFAVMMLALAGCSSARLTTDTNPISSATPPVLVAIGDSIMKGHSLSAAQAWPAMLAVSSDRALTNLACDGDCNCNGGDDVSGLVDTALALHPALILISGGSDNDTLSTETNPVVSSLRAKLPSTTIVGISTVWCDTGAPDQLEASTGRCARRSWR
jgi:hypothetical protein